MLALSYVVVRRGDAIRSIGLPVHEFLLLVAVGFAIAYLPAGAGLRWWNQWRCFRRPSASLPPPGTRGTIEGTVVAAEETVPAPHVPSIACVASQPWEHGVNGIDKHARIRPFVPETSFGRFRITVDERGWHPSLILSLTWNDGSSTVMQFWPRFQLRVRLNTWIMAVCLAALVVPALYFAGL
jgi:hypothetical protein